MQRKPVTSFQESSSSGVMQDALISSSNEFVTTHVKYCLPRKFLGNSVPSFVIEGWSCRQPLAGFYQNSRLPEEIQVFGINNIICTVSHLIDQQFGCKLPGIHLITAGCLPTAKRDVELYVISKHNLFHKRKAYKKAVSPPMRAFLYFNAIQKAICHAFSPLSKKYSFTSQSNLIDTCTLCSIVCLFFWLDYTLLPLHYFCWKCFSLISYEVSMACYVFTHRLTLPEARL